MKELCRKMHQIRKSTGEILSSQIQNELLDLEMKNTKFKVSIEYFENSEFDENGQDKIEFLILTNVGEDFKPLTKIASGGEMSRIMLAIKRVLADVSLQKLPRSLDFKSFHINNIPYKLKIIIINSVLSI